jgi:hypothetical protein
MDQIKTCTPEIAAILTESLEGFTIKENHTLLQILRIAFMSQDENQIKQYSEALINILKTKGSYLYAEKLNFDEIASTVNDKITNKDDVICMCHTATWRSKQLAISLANLNGNKVVGLYPDEPDFKTLHVDKGVEFHPVDDKKNMSTRILNYLLTPEDKRVLTPLFVFVESGKMPEPQSLMFTILNIIQDLLETSQLEADVVSNIETNLINIINGDLSSIGFDLNLIEKTHPRNKTV